MGKRNTGPNRQHGNTAGEKPAGKGAAPESGPAGIRASLMPGASRPPSPDNRCKRFTPLRMGTLVYTNTPEFMAASKEVEETFRVKISSFGGLGQLTRFRAFRPDGSEYAPRDWPFMRTLLRGETVRNEEMRILLDDGSLVIALVSSSYLTAGSNSVTVIFKEITGQRGAEAAVMESEEWLTIAFQASRSGAFIWDAKTDKSYWSDEMLALYGIKREEHHGHRQDWIDLLAPEDRAACLAAVDQAMKGDEFKIDFRVRRLDTGEVRWLHARARAILDDKGRPEKLIGINMDITDRKRAEEEVRKTRDGLEERVRERTQELETVYASLQRSEARYKDLFDQANDVIFTADPEGRITSANRKAAEVFLPSGAPLQHPSIADFLTPESAGRAADVLRRALADDSDLPDEQPWDFEAWTKDGNLVSLEVTARFMRENGVVTGVHGIARDVTQRKRMQEEMAKLLSAVEHAGDGIFMLSPDRRYTYVNSAFARMYGYTADEMVGSSPVMTRSDAHPDSFHEAIYSELLAGNTWTGRQTRKKQDGTLVEIETTLVPIRDEYGTTIQYVGVDRDITRQLEIEQQLRQKQKMEAIGTLAGGIAHDFNNMLAVILGNSELALDDLDGTDAKRNIEQVIKASKRARDLIKQILTFSRKSEHGKNVFQLTPLVKETFKLLRSSLPSTVRMKLDIRAANDYIAGDPSQVQQVLMNLAANAAHAMQPAGGSL